MDATLNPWMKYLKVIKRPANRGAQIQGTKMVKVKVIPQQAEVAQGVPVRLTHSLPAI